MRRFVCIFLFIIPVLLYSQNAGISENKESPVPKLSASVDRTRVYTGDMIKLTLKYSVPEESTFSPETDLAGLEGLTITAREAKKNEIIFTIMADKTSAFKIGPVSLSFKDKQGSLNIIRSEAVTVEILSNLGNNPAEAELKPITDIIPVYPLWKKILPWAGGFLLLALAVSGFYFLKKRKRDELKKMASRQPHIIAREEIEKLMSMGFVDKGKHKEFYFRFSEILRQYLENIRGFPAAESTTEEISRRIRIETDRKLVPVLRGADLVKFADKVPTKAMNEEDIRIALEYIRETAPAGTSSP